MFNWNDLILSFFITTVIYAFIWKMVILKFRSNARFLTLCKKMCIIYRDVHKIEITLADDEPQLVLAYDENSNVCNIGIFKLLDALAEFPALFDYCEHSGKIICTKNTYFSILDELFKNDIINISARMQNSFEKYPRFIQRRLQCTYDEILNIPKELGIKVEKNIT